MGNTAQFAALIACAISAGCLEAELLDCGNGMVCPATLSCDLAHATCVAADQLSACAGAVQDASCTTSDIAAGVCREGTCLPRACGNSYVDPGEVCDDGNESDADGCRADCLSDEMCGGGVVDSEEDCDDGNLTSHDGCDSRCRNETLVWTPFRQVFTPKTIRAVSAWDTTRNELIVFGDGVAPSNLIRIWDGNAWRESAPRGPQPPARSMTAIAYDPNRRELVMFGGHAGGSEPVADTWIWDGVHWSEREVVGNVVGPQPRSSHTLTYDRARNRIVMIGGTRGSFALGDVWEWDGDRWTEVVADAAHPGPIGLRGHAAAYDPERQVIVVYGGDDGSTSTSATWLWNGQWTRAEDAPLTIFGAAMSYSPVLHEMIVSGAGSVLRWNGEHWSEPQASPQAVRTWHVSFFDTHAQTTMISGGTSDDLLSRAPYAFDDATTKAFRAITLPIVQSNCVSPVLTYDPQRARAIQWGGFCGNGTRETWELVGETWQRRAQNLTNDPVQPNGFVSSTFDSRRHVTIVYRETASSFVHEWNGQTWTAAPAPGGRLSAALAYDSAIERTFLVGGKSNDGLVPDVWSWDGMTWRAEEAGPLRKEHRMAYDPRRHALVVFGGVDLAGAGTNEVWERRDDKWTPIPFTGDGPRPRRNFAMAYVEAFGETLVFGGETITADPSVAGTPLRDLWAWNGTRWREIQAAGAPAQPTGVSMTYDAARASVIATNAVGMWELRWEASEGLSDNCTLALDLDEDGLAGCDDADCDWSCQ